MPRKKKTELETQAAVQDAVIEQQKPEKKKPAQKKSAATKKPAEKAAQKAPKETVVVQFAGKEFDVEEIKAKVKADYKGKVKGKVNILDIYVKPEDGAAYYVVNDISGKVEL